MVKMVDTTDLKSVAKASEFESRWPHQRSTPMILGLDPKEDKDLIHKQLQACKKWNISFPMIVWKGYNSSSSYSGLFRRNINSCKYAANEGILFTYLGIKYWPIDYEE